MAIYDSILNLEPGRNHLAEIDQGRNQPNSSWPDANKTAANLWMSYLLSTT